jgi:hypothetical protein
MSFRAKITNHAGWTKELEALYDRLNTAGFRVQATRLDAYRKTFATIDKFITENRQEELVKKVPFPTFANDLHESQEFIEACDEFPDLTQPGLRDRIEKVLKGARELEKETPERGEARNYLFELVMAGLLKRAGFKVRLDRIEDVSLEYSDRPFFIECKRILSQAKLQERIDHAANQIGKRCNDAGTQKARGVIAIDISKLLNDGKSFLQCPTLEALNSEVETLFNLFRQMHGAELGTRKEARVLGLYVYLRLPGQVSNPPGSHTCRKSSFSVFHRQGTKDSTLAERFFRKLEPAVTDI